MENKLNVDYHIYEGSLDLDRLQKLDLAFNQIIEIKVQGLLKVF